MRRCQVDTLVFVNCLTLVIVFSVRLAVGAGDGLGRFVRLKAEISRLMFVGFGIIAEAVVAEHEVVVRLKVLGIDTERGFKLLHGIGIAFLKEEHTSELVVDHAIARVLREHALQVRCGFLVLTLFPEHASIKEMRPCQLRVNRQRFLQGSLPAFRVAFLYQGAADIHPAIGILSRPARTNRCRNRSIASNLPLTGLFADLVAAP